MRVGVRCDAGVRRGAGHLIRCVALAEELLSRGIEVVFLGEVDGPGWIRDQLSARGLPLSPAPATPAGLATLARLLCLDAMVIDSYETDPGCAEAVRRIGVRVLAIVDGDLRGQHADLYLDQNLGAEETAAGLPAGSERLAGVRFVLLRDSVRAMRTARPPEQGDGPPRVLCFFGGTDAADVAPAVAGLAAATGAPFAATVVAARDSTVRALAAVPLAAGQSITPIAPTDRIPELAAQADLVLSAAGSSTWELLCLGVPTALVRVAGNQRLGYEATVSRGLTAGLSGSPEAAGRTLRGLLLDPAARTRLAVHGHGLIDGRGRERVADALTRRAQASGE